MPERSGAYGPDLPPIEFCIDSPAIEPGERDMFLFGFEYAMQLAFLMRRSTTAWPREVHAANEFRLRKLFTLFKRTYKFTPIEGRPEWLTLDVGPAPEAPEEEPS